MALSHIKAGGGNGHAPGFKTRLLICLETDLTNGSVLPATDANANRISSNIGFKPAVAAAAGPPAVAARPAGECIEFIMTPKGTKFSLGGKDDGGISYFQPMLECKNVQTTPEKDMALASMSGERLFVCFENGNGQRIVSTGVTMTYDAVTDDNTNSYNIKFTYEYMNKPPATYTGTIPVKAS
jgi:hypothetical protein